MPEDAPPAGPREGLRRRLAVLVALLLGLLVVNALAATALSMQRAREQALVRERLSPAVVAGDRLLTAYVDMETGLRGYVLTGSDEFLEPYRSGDAASQRWADELRRLLADDPALLGHLDEVQARAR
jgi:CHASE3 domain sensor protein